MEQLFKATILRKFKQFLVSWKNLLNGKDSNEKFVWNFDQYSGAWKPNVFVFQGVDAFRFIVQCCVFQPANACLRMRLHGWKQLKIYHFPMFLIVFNHANACALCKHALAGWNTQQYRPSKNLWLLIPQWGFVIENDLNTGKLNDWKCLLFRFVCYLDAH